MSSTNENARVMSPDVLVTKLTERCFRKPVAPPDATSSKPSCFSRFDLRELWPVP